MWHRAIERQQHAWPWPDGNEKSNHHVFHDTGVVQLNVSDMAADAAGTAFMLMMLP
jgi:hypothetical protein